LTGQLALKQDSLEEYLTGKEYTVKSEKTELKEVESQPGMLFVGSVNAKNEMFSRLHEDPLLLIKQNELKVSDTRFLNSCHRHRIISRCRSSYRVSRILASEHTLGSCLQKREDLVKNPVKMARIKKQLEDEIRVREVES
jgi:hypothetical protein